MVTPMQEPQEGEVRVNRRTGVRAIRQNGEWIVQDGAQAAPAGPQASVPGLIPMQTPAEQRAREERDYDRQRDTVQDDRTDRREWRAIEAAERQAVAAEHTNERLTEDQGKAGGFARDMADAEASYQVALEEGFNPTGFRAGVANFTDNIPMMGGAGNIIRDDAGDRARQAELQWTDAALKAKSGAASPDDEVTRNNITYFARPGQNYDYLGERLEQARGVAFESSRIRAGSAAAGVSYPETGPARTADIQRGSHGSSGPLAGPQYDADWNEMTDAERSALRRGARVLMPQNEGETFRQVVTLSADIADPQRETMPGDRERSFGGVRAREMGPADAIGAYASGAVEQVPGGDEAITGIGALVNRQSFSESRAEYQDMVGALNEQQRGWRNAGGITGGLALAATPLGAPLRVFKGGGAAVAGATRGADRMRRLANAGNAAAGGTAAGAAWGLGQGEGNVFERLPDAGAGALTGALAGPVAAPLANALTSGARVAARPFVNAFGERAPAFAREFVRPTALSPRARDVETLRANGVNLTPGQRMGGMAQSVENLAQRAPILGPAIRGARERGVESMNRAKGNIALDHIDEGVPGNIPAGGGMVDHVQQRLGAQFDRAYAMVPEINVQDPTLLEGLARVERAKWDLAAPVRDQYDAIVAARLQRLQGGVASGEVVGGIRSELNTLAGQYLKAADPDQQRLGSMIAELGDELDGAITRANPEAGAILQNARGGYSEYIQLERASTAANGRPFSPRQLENAVKASDGTVRHGAMGRSNARGQEFANAAQTVMPDSFGNPGTADVAGLGALGLGMLNAPATTSVVAAGLGTVSLPYLAMGRKVIERLPEGTRRILAAVPDQELDALMQAAADPSRQADMIDMLANRTETRREARNLARALRYQAAGFTTGPQSAPQP